MKRIAIIDGFSSGKHIANILYKQGCELFHIISNDNHSDYYLKSFDQSIYCDNIIHTKLDLTSKYIKNNCIEFVIAGTETGVELADKINHFNTLSYKNGKDKAIARRNKYAMIESLRESGITATKQIQSNRWSEIKSWIDIQGLPVVAKPINSAGSDSVFVCQTLEEAHSAFSNIYGKTNKLNLKNNTVLFQEFLEGTEFVVNFVSLNKKVVVTEVVKYHKRQLSSGNVVYDIDEILDASYPDFAILVSYVKQVCSCLQIENGPSHAEVMLTPNGPCLVEIAARSDGILRPNVSLETTGMGQIEATALSLTQPKAFEDKSKENFYTLLKHSFNVCLISPRRGKLSKKRFYPLLQSLPSFHSVEYYINDGDNVEQTKDVFSQPATIYLVHDDKTQLWQDHNRIRNFELLGGYLEPE